ncbi:MAG: YqiA/YcfP family alpha/beta fold hydrolase [Promethearchaeota archaeon]
MQIIYLYGFASGPLSNKAQFYKDKFSFSGIPFDIYDYVPDEDSFTNMKLSVLIDNLHTNIENNYSVEEELILFGSSFGALISTLFPFFHPNRIAKLILMAPALGFSAQRLVKIHNIPLGLWKKKGNIPVFHFRYEQEIPLGYSFYEDLLNNPPPKIKKLRIDVPTLILHGKFDDVVPLSWSQQFVEINPKATLHILDGNHQLLDQKEVMWKLVEEFLNRD